MSTVTARRTSPFAPDLAEAVRSALAAPSWRPPLLPAVALEVLQLTRSPDVQLSDVVSLLEPAQIELLANVNIGVAIALDESRGGGLIVATLRHADQIGLRQVSARSKALSEKARTKGLSIEEMSDSTFTISNLGMFGVEHFTAIINPPNAAILAVGAAVEKPVVAADARGEKKLVIGHEMQMTMSSDHRVIDGAMAAQYLQTVKHMLETPATLLV